MTNSKHPTQNKQHDGRVLVQAGALWSGPLPPPETLEQFNQVIPDGANRIMCMVEQEQRQRHENEKRVTEAETRDTRRGQWMGFVIAISALSSSLASAYLGAHWIVSTAFVSLPVAAIITGFMAKPKDDPKKK